MSADRSLPAPFDPVPIGRGGLFWLAAAAVALALGVAGTAVGASGDLVESSAAAAVISLLGLALLTVLLRRLRLSSLLAAAAAALGLIALAGVATPSGSSPLARIDSLAAASGAIMAPTSAVLALAVGASLLLSALRQPPHWARAASWALVMVALTVPVLVVLGESAGLDALVYWDGVTRTPPALLLTFTVLALVLLISPLHAQPETSPPIRHVFWVYVLFGMLTGPVWWDAYEFGTRRVAADLDAASARATASLDARLRARIELMTALAERWQGRTVPAIADAIAAATDLAGRLPLTVIHFEDGRWQRRPWPDLGSDAPALSPQQEPLLADLAKQAVDSHRLRATVVRIEPGSASVLLAQPVIVTEGIAVLLSAVQPPAHVADPDDPAFAFDDAISLRVLAGVPARQRPEDGFETRVRPVSSLAADLSVEVTMASTIARQRIALLPRIVLLADLLALGLALTAVALVAALHARARHAEALVRELGDQHAQRRIGEAALKRSRAETHNILESLDEGVLVLSPDWIVLAANKAIRPLLGRPPTALLGRELWTAVPEFRGGRAEGALRRAMIDAAPTGFDLDSPDVERDLAVRTAPHLGGLVVSLRDVSEERAAARRLERSEALLTLSQELAHLGSWQEGRNGALWWSDQTYRVHGLDPARFVPSLDAELDLIDGDDRERFAQARHDLRTGTPEVELVYRIRGGDGVERHLRLLGRCLRDGHGRVIRVHGSVQDVTAQVRTEERLQRSLDLLNSAEEIAGLGSWEYEVSSDRMTWSRNIYRIHGLDPASYQPRIRGATELVHPDDRDALREARSRALARGRPFQVEYRLPTTDRGERRILAIGRPRFDDAGRMIALLGTVQDITERHAAEQELRRNLALLEMAEDIADLGSWAFKPDTGEVNWSRQAYRIHGVDPDRPDPTPEKSARLIHPDDRERVIAERIQSTALGWPVDIRYRIVRPDGEVRLLHVLGRPLLDRDGHMRLMHGSVQDVTERNRLEQDLRRTIVELKARNRDLHDFTRIASHDLREPLRKIQVFSDLLLGRVGTDGRDITPMHDTLTRMRDIAGRMQRLLADLTQFALIEDSAPQPRRTDPGAFAARIAEAEQGALADCAGRLELAIAADCPAIHTDPDLLAAILRNLFANAIDHRSPDRPPAIRLTITPTHEPTAPAVCTGWRLTLSDNGIGFDPRHAERIFAPFQTLADRTDQTGTGMGLTLARRLTERLGGRIVADARPDQGAEFTIEAPDMTRDAG